MSPALTSSYLFFVTLKKGRHSMLWVGVAEIDSWPVGDPNDVGVDVHVQFVVVRGALHQHQFGPRGRVVDLVGVGGVCHVRVCVGRVAGAVSGGIGQLQIDAVDGLWVATGPRGAPGSALHHSGNEAFDTWARGRARARGEDHQSSRGADGVFFGQGVVVVFHGVCDFARKCKWGGWGGEWKRDDDPLKKET